MHIWLRFSKGIPLNILSSTGRTQTLKYELKGQKQHSVFYLKLYNKTTLTETEMEDATGSGVSSSSLRSGSASTDDTSLSFTPR